MKEEKRESVSVTIEEKRSSCAPGADEADMQWVCPYLIGAMNGVLVISSSMVGMGAVRESSDDMIVTGLTTLILGICRITSTSIYKVYIDRNLKTVDSKKKMFSLAGTTMDILAYALGTVDTAVVGDVFLVSFPVKMVTLSVACGTSLFGFSAVTAWLMGAYVILFAVWGIFYVAASTGLSSLVPTLIKYYFT